GKLLRAVLEAVTRAEEAQAHVRTAPSDRFDEGAGSLFGEPSHDEGLARLAGEAAGVGREALQNATAFQEIEGVRRKIGEIPHPPMAIVEDDDVRSEGAVDVQERCSAARIVQYVLDAYPEGFGSELRETRNDGGWKTRSGHECRVPGLFGRLLQGQNREIRGSLPQRHSPQGNECKLVTEPLDDAAEPLEAIQTACDHHLVAGDQDALSAPLSVDRPRGRHAMILSDPCLTRRIHLPVGAHLSLESFALRR